MPIHTAIFYNRPRAFRALHRLGARLGDLTPNGENIFRIAVNRAKFLCLDSSHKTSNLIKEL